MNVSLNFFKSYPFFAIRITPINGPFHEKGHSPIQGKRPIV